MPSRYLIGIDLGTTNSVVAYIDTQEVADAGSPIRVFPSTAVGGDMGKSARFPHFLPFFTSPPKMSCLPEP